MKLRKRSQIVAVIALASLLVACTDSTLTTVAKDLDVAAKTVGTVQSTVIQANQQQLISTDTTRTILTACETVNTIGKQVVAYTRTISTLSPQDRTVLTNMLDPAIKAVANLVASGTVGIKDVATQQKIQLLLASLQATLGAVQIAISGGA